MFDRKLQHRISVAAKTTEKRDGKRQRWILDASEQGGRGGGKKKDNFIQRKREIDGRRQDKEERSRVEGEEMMKDEEREMG